MAARNHDATNRYGHLGGNDSGLAYDSAEYPTAMSNSSDRIGPTSGAHSYEAPLVFATSFAG